MLGGKVRESIPLYANHGIFFDTDTSFNFSIERIVHARDAGYKMFKWDPASDFDQVRQARQAVGQEYRLAIDQHGQDHGKHHNPRSHRADHQGGCAPCDVPSQPRRGPVDGAHTRRRACRNVRRHSQHRRHDQ